MKDLTFHLLYLTVKPSMIRNKTPAKWKNTKALSDARNFLPDEMSLFWLQDNVNNLIKKSMRTDIWERCQNNRTLTMIIYDSVKYILSNTRAFWELHLKEKSNMSYIFHLGVSSTIQASANRVSNLKKWS